MRKNALDKEKISYHLCCYASLSYHVCSDQGLKRKKIIYDFMYYENINLF